jgi:hypothetical protein
MQAPKELDARLEALGGQRLAPIYLDDFGLFKEVYFRAFLSLVLVMHFPASITHLRATLSTFSHIQANEIYLC